MGHETTGAKFGRSRSRGFGATRVRFSGFPFEWDMAYNNLPCTTVQAVIFFCFFSKCHYLGFIFVYFRNSSSSFHRFRDISIFESRETHPERKLAVGGATLLK
jgi:hypothetical protein